MSTALIESERFCDLHRSLNYHATEGMREYGCPMITAELARALGVSHPFGQSGREAVLAAVRSLVFDLQRLNHAAYVARYEDAANEPPPRPTKPEGKLLTLCATLKTLRCIRYNSDGGKVANKSLLASLALLDKLTDTIRDCIIEELPEYQEADWF